MNKMLLMLTLAMTFAITACSGCTTPGAELTDSQERTIATSCATASAALFVLTDANKAGKLSAEVQVQIAEGAALVVPICSAPEPPTLDSVQMYAFTQAVALLAAKSAEARSP